MSNCYICGEEITPQNESEEHIIPNSCGGRLKSKSIICSRCNNLCGSNSDKSLGEQVAPLMQLLGLKRERGKTPPVEVETNESRKKFLFQDGEIIPPKGKPTLPSSGNGYHLRFMAESKEQARKIAESIIDHPILKQNAWTVDEILKKAETKHVKIDDFFHFNIVFGGDALPSIIKILANFYAYHNGDCRYIKNLIPYINGEKKPNIISPCLHKDYTPADNEISHVIKVVGDPREKILWGYIELFNLYKMAMLITDNYDGEVFDKSYIYDLKNRMEISKHLDIKFDKLELLQLRKNNDKGYENIKKCLSNLIKKTNHKDLIKPVDTKRIIGDAMHETWDRYPEGSPITEQMINEFTSVLITKLWPYIKC